MSKSQQSGISIAEEKRDYLALIQEPIGRLSTASSVFKGFAATIVTGIAALSYSEIELKLLILSFIPILAFAALDVFYLRLEKRYRGLYKALVRQLTDEDYAAIQESCHAAIARYFGTAKA